MKNGKPLDQDPLFAARMAQVEIDLENMKTTNLRVIAAVAGGGVPGAWKAPCSRSAAPRFARKFCR